MAFEDFDNLPVNWSDHEDIAMGLAENLVMSSENPKFTESGLLIC
ncbi:hypothetical protein MASR1M65_11080 [Saprospiraceae bacterium]